MTITIRATRQASGLAPLLVWVYQQQKADEMTGRSLWVPESEAVAEPVARPRHQTSGCGCAQLATIAALGSRINSPGRQRPSLHPDAEAIHDALVEMSQEDWMGAMLLHRYGRQGGTPDWGSGYQELSPIYNARSKIIQDRFDEMVSARDAVGREFMVPLRYCPLQPYPSDDWVDLTRGEYRMWVSALERLAARLVKAKLIRWRLEGLGVEREPWGTKRENRP